MKFSDLTDGELVALLREEEVPEEVQHELASNPQARAKVSAVREMLKEHEATMPVPQSTLGSEQIVQKLSDVKQQPRAERLVLRLVDIVARATGIASEVVTRTMVGVEAPLRLAYLGAGDEHDAEAHLWDIIVLGVTRVRYGTEVSWSLDYTCTLPRRPLRGWIKWPEECRDETLFEFDNEAQRSRLRAPNGPDKGGKAYRTVAVAEADVVDPNSISPLNAEMTAVLFEEFSIAGADDLSPNRVAFLLVDRGHIAEGLAIATSSGDQVEQRDFVAALRLIAALRVYSDLLREAVEQSALSARHARLMESRIIKEIEDFSDYL